jgi:hypothetical protein
MYVKLSEKAQTFWDVDLKQVGKKELALRGNRQGYNWKKRGYNT